MNIEIFKETYHLLYIELFKGLEEEYFNKSEIEEMLLTANYTISEDKLEVEYSEGSKDFYLIESKPILKLIDKIWGDK